MISRSVRGTCREAAARGRRARMGAGPARRQADGVVARPGRRSGGVVPTWAWALIGLVMWAVIVWLALSMFWAQGKDIDE
jgi:hypothetical protein